MLLFSNRKMAIFFSNFDMHVNIKFHCGSDFISTPKIELSDDDIGPCIMPYSEKG